MTSVIEESITATPSSNELSVNNEVANDTDSATPATNKSPVASGDEEKATSSSPNELEKLGNGDKATSSVNIMLAKEIMLPGMNKKVDHVPIISHIKQEDPLDIDEDEPRAVERMPKISLTPAAKLLAIKPVKNFLDPKRKFVCPYENCGKSYGKSSHLRSHLTWHTGIKPFVCREPNCGKGFTRSDELNRHVRTHTGEKPFECVQCTKKFSRSDHLTKHLATHLKQQIKTPRRNSNNATKNTSIGNNNASNSSKPELINEAAFDSEAMNSNKDQKQHLKRMLPPDDDDDDDDNDDEMNNEYKGNETTFASVENKRQRGRRGNTETFAARDLLNINLEADETSKKRGTPLPPFKHQPIKLKLERPENGKDYQIVPMSILKNAATADDNLEPSPSNTRSELICGDDEIMPEANLPPLDPNAEVSVKKEPIHPDLEDETSPTEERPPRCENCDRVFRCEKYLNQHKRFNECGQAPDLNGAKETISVQPDINPYLADAYYDPSRPFFCTECPKNFRRQDDLNRHMRTHTGEKPFACNECDRRFVRSDHLKKHMLTHTRVR